jgi:hypothetical protein
MGNIIKPTSNLSEASKQAISELMRMGDIPVCDYKKWYNVQVPAHKSASNTIIIIMDLMTSNGLIPVACKLFLDSEFQIEERRYLNEAIVYRDYISKLKDKGYTPCLIGFIAFSKCPSFQRLPSKLEKLYGDKKLIADIVAPLKTQLKTMVRKFNRHTINPDDDLLSRDINVLMVQRATNSTTIYQFIKDLDGTPASTNHLISVIFQVLWTLECFNRIGLRHNDLHLGNIFIQHADAQMWHKYVLPDGSERWTYQLYLPLIYDFDRTAIFDVARNQSIITNIKNPEADDTSDICENWGECNTYHPKYDAYTFLYLVHRAMTLHGKSEKYPEVMNFVDDVISKALRLAQRKLSNKKDHADQKSPYLLRNLDPFKNGEMPIQEIPDVPDGKITTLWMRPVSYMLEHPLFSSLTKPDGEFQFVVHQKPNSRQDL